MFNAKEEAYKFAEAFIKTRKGLDSRDIEFAYRCGVDDAIKAAGDVFVDLLRERMTTE